MQSTTSIPPPVLSLCRFLLTRPSAFQLRQSNISLLSPLINTSAWAIVQAATSEGKTIRCPYLPYCIYPPPGVRLLSLTMADRNVCELLQRSETIWLQHSHSKPMISHRGKKKAISYPPSSLTYRVHLFFPSGLSPLLSTRLLRRSSLSVARASLRALKKPW